MLGKDILAGGGSDGRSLAGDPVLRSVARQRSAVLTDAIDHKSDATLAQLEEPYEVDSYVETKQFSAAFESALPSEYNGRLAVMPVDIDDVDTEGEEDEVEDAEESDEEGGDGEAVGDDQQKRQPSIPRPVLPGIPLWAERDAQAGEMAQALLQRGVQSPAEMLDEEADAIQSSLTDPDSGDLRSPADVAGVEYAERGHLEYYRRHRYGLPQQESLESIIAREATYDHETGTRLKGIWGSHDPAGIQEGMLEELAAPYDFYGHQAKEQGAGIDTEREASMTPAERQVNDQRKKLRDMIEKPMPVVTRPIWPLYAMLAGVDQVQQVVKGGMIASTRCMVIVGNGMGGIGFGLGKHKEPADATKQALLNAQRDMIHIDTHHGGLHHDLIGKKNNVYVIIRAAPTSSGILKAAPLIADVFELAGITRASAKIVGSHRRNPYIVTQALFDAFNHHYPPQQEAYMRGLRYVPYTSDRLYPRTVYPQQPKGPRFPPANSRLIKGSLRT